MPDSEILIIYANLFIGESHQHDDFDRFKVKAHAAFFIIGILSIFGNVSVVIANCLWLPEKTGSRRLVLSIALSEIIATSCYLWGFILTEQDPIYHQFNNTCEPLPSFEPTQPCVIQGFIMNIFALSSFMHHAFLSFLIVSVVYMCHVDHINAIIRVSRVFPWIIATIFPFLAAWNGVYGFSPCSTAGWCWLGNVQYQHSWVLLTGRFWEILTQIIIYSCYGAAISKLGFQKTRALSSRRRRTIKFSPKDECGNDCSQYEELEGSVNVEDARRFIRKLVFLPLCFSLCYLPGFIRYEVMLQSFLKKGTVTQEDNVDKMFYFLHGAGNCMTGIPNFFIFVLSNQHVKDRAKVICSNYSNSVRQGKVKYQRSSVILAIRHSTIDSSGECRDLITESSLLLTPNSPTSTSGRSQNTRASSRSWLQFERQESDIGFLS